MILLPNVFRDYCNLKLKYDYNLHAILGFAITAVFNFYALAEQISLRCDPPSGFVTVEQFGGNGLDGSDDTEAFIRALKVGNVYLCPGGRYHISSTISIPDGRIIQSEQDNRAVIVLAKGQNSEGYTITGDSLAGIDVNQLDRILRRKCSDFDEDLYGKCSLLKNRIVGLEMGNKCKLLNIQITIEHSDNQSTIAVPILANLKKEIIIERVTIEDFFWMPAGIMIDGCDNVEIYGCQIINANTNYCPKIKTSYKPESIGILIDEATIIESEEVTISHCLIGNIMQSSAFADCRQADSSIYSLQSDAINVVKGKNIRINNSIFYRVNEGIDIFTDGALIEDNNFRNVCTGMKINHGASNNIIKNNNFDSLGMYGLLLVSQNSQTPVKENLISGNVIRGMSGNTLATCGDYDRSIIRSAVALYSICCGTVEHNTISTNEVSNLKGLTYWLHCGDGVENNTIIGNVINGLPVINNGNCKIR